MPYSATRRGFTLIELLVVIAIIAILAAILFPAFARAKAKAQQTFCLNNEKQIGTALIAYLSDYGDTYPMAYYYLNGKDATGGYMQLSGMLDPYVQNNGIWVCPSNPFGGFAPANFVTGQGIYGPVNPPAGQTPLYNVNDYQVPRITYTANEMLMPRLKYFGIAQQCPPSTLVAHPADTIAFAEFSFTMTNILDSSGTGGTAFKSHRPTNGVEYTGGGIYNGETYTLGTGVQADTYQGAEAMIAQAVSQGSAGTTCDHICYLEPNAHNNGSNYCFADGHAKWEQLQTTLDPANFQWGKKCWVCPTVPPVINTATGAPVQ